MLIEIESTFGDTLLHGKCLPAAELKSQVKHILFEAGEEGFISVFCARCQYEVLPDLSNEPVDYVIDLDTHLIYAPTYDYGK